MSLNHTLNRRACKRHLRVPPSGLRLGGQLTLIRHYFEAAQAMSPTAVGNGTQP
jgi:hypothetical protein